MCESSPSKLTRKQQLFVAEYCTSLNATKAAIAAGYSKARAASTGSRLASNGKVQAEISRQHSERLGRLNITAERVIQELGKLAFFDPRELFDSDGSPKQIHELDEDTAAAVAGLEVCELFEGTGEQKHAYGLVKKIKIADKVAALERLGKYFKLFTDKVEARGQDGGTIPTTLIIDL